jgi:hypothetical protein
MKSFDTKHFPHLLAGKGQQAELLVIRRPNTQKPGQFYTNIVGIKRIGVKEFDLESGLPAIQNRDREAGQTLPNT